MRDKIINYFVIGVALLFIATIIREVVVKRSEQVEAEQQRQHVFCELLQEGMTYAQVSEVLAQLGSFKELPNNINGTYTLRMVSTDSKTRFADGILLYFGLDGRYGGASIYVDASDRVPLCKDNK
ncbi:MAG TPA: hypothetical protein VMP08_03295 [Anaerolineae bacterium]|nr:hypothetical protein [Anaerolineae bacterium]